MVRFRNAFSPVFFAIVGATAMLSPAEPAISQILPLMGASGSFHTSSPGSFWNSSSIDSLKVDDLGKFVMYYHDDTGAVHYLTITINKDTLPYYGYSAFGSGFSADWDGLGAVGGDTCTIVDMGSGKVTCTFSNYSPLIGGTFSYTRYAPKFIRATNPDTAQFVYLADTTLKLPFPLQFGGKTFEKQFDEFFIPSGWFFSTQVKVTDSLDHIVVTPYGPYVSDDVLDTSGIFVPWLPIGRNKVTCTWTGNNLFYVTDTTAYTSSILIYPPSFLLVDQKGDTVRNTHFIIYRASRIPAQDSLIAPEATDGFGRITIDSTKYPFGDTLRFEYFVANGPSRNGSPAYYISLNNLQFDTIGNVLFDTVSHDGIQVIHIGHAYVDLNTAVSIEWAAEQNFVDTLKSDFRKLANYLYDVYDGQVQINSVTIWDSSLSWSTADVQYFTTTEQWPCVSNLPGNTEFTLSLINGSIKMPRRWIGSQYLPERTILADTGWLNYWGPNRENFRVVGHEMGHLYFNFGDEYVGITGYLNSTPANNLGYMDNSLPGYGPYCSELSSKSRYQQVGNPYTKQWGIFGESCWDDFASLINTVIHKNTQIHCDILTPENRPLKTGFIYLPGPNDENYNAGLAQYDVGSLVNFTTFTRTGSKSVRYHFALPGAGTSYVAAAKVELQNPASNQTMDEGVSGNNGNFLVIGAYSGDIVTASASNRLSSAPWHWATPLDSELVVPSAIRKGIVPASGGSVIEVPMREATGSYAFLPLCSWQSNGNLKIGLVNAVPFLSVPSVTLLEPASPNFNATMNYDNTTSSYSAELSSVPLSSPVIVNATDSSGYALPIFLDYSMTDSTLLPQSGNGKVQLILDSLNNSAIQRFACVSSDYPCPLDGLPSDAENMGAIYAISFYPPGVTLHGNNQLFITYGDSAISHPQSDIQIFKWNTSSRRWTELGGSVDSINSGVSAAIQSDGIYGVFATSQLAGVDSPRPDQSTNIELSPNPTTGVVTIRSTATEVLGVTVTNVLGLNVLEFSNASRSANFTIEISELPAGTFFLRIATPVGIQIRKIVRGM